MVESSQSSGCNSNYLSFKIATLIIVQLDCYHYCVLIFVNVLFLVLQIFVYNKCNIHTGKIVNAPVIVIS